MTPRGSWIVGLGLACSVLLVLSVLRSLCCSFGIFQNAFLFLWVFLYNSFINFDRKKILSMNFFQLNNNILILLNKICFIKMVVWVDIQKYVFNDVILTAFRNLSHLGLTSICVFFVCVTICN